MSRRAVDTRHRKKLGTRRMRIRLILLFVATVAGCFFLTWKIYSLHLDKGETYQKKALAQQSYVSNVIQYRRGDIVDRNGNVLASSVKVYNLILDPKMMLEDDGKHVAATKEALNDVFQISSDEIESILDQNPTSRYYQMKEYRLLSAEQKEAFEKKEEKQKEESKDSDTYIQGAWFEETYKRVYPYSTVASDVIGFLSDTNTGAWGLENQYNEQLNGSYGRSYGYYDSDLNLVQTVKEAKNGNTVKSTIDVNVQGILEQHIEKFMSETGAKNLGCILMDPNNGEVLAMGSNNPYDLNNPRDLSAFYSKEKLATMSDKKKLEKLNELWRNYCISDSYEPGSTFKPITVSAAIDEGICNGNTYYDCDGGQQIGTYYIKCVAHSSGGHGSINVCQSLMLSCNDVLMQLGAALGKNKFLDYVDRYGYGRRTGIDLPGEATGSVFNQKTMHETELATSSFGQGQTVTMIQMASAFSAVINGGNYYQPHVMKEIDSDSGAIVDMNTDHLENKVITDDTSKKIRKYLYKTVESGTATAAQVKGYQVGGKTGTAEKVPRGKGNYLVSFIGCVPYKNPQLVAYVVIDEPNVADQAHSTFATQFSSELMADVLPLLGIYPDNGKKKATNKNLTLPSTQNGNSMLEAPEGGLTDGEDIDVSDTDADGNAITDETEPLEE